MQSQLEQQKQQEQQQKQQELFQEQLLELCTQQHNDTKALYEAILLKNNPVNSSFTAEGIANSITEFKFNPDEGVTFPAYFRFETIFEKNAKAGLTNRK